MILTIYIIVSVFVAGKSATDAYNELQLDKASVSTGVFQFILIFWVFFFIWPIIIFIKK